MKIIYIVLQLLIIIGYINIAKSQIIHGASLATGIVSLTGLTRPFNETNIIASKNIRVYQRYDWSILKVYLRSNESLFTGEINIHPRVGDIITGGGNGISRWPGWQIWVELPVKKNITTFVSEILDSPCVVNGTRLNNTECSTPVNGTAPVTFKETVITNKTETVPLTLPPKNIIDVNKNTFVNYFAIVIQLDRGNIIDAIWDGDRLPQICKSCDSCIDNQCAVNYGDMACDAVFANNGTNNGCQVKLMVAFAGRDLNNRPCQSVNKLPSNFQKYSATSIKKIGTGLLSDFFYKINENNNNPNRA
ncbi:hypothetical protein DICPUDRAFT_25267 [Dictyostelium purpureum]|uniref:Uncharacterized protein n=1 Tax=Dictyostelium purpureum TaxID=5786 RepID=F0Z6M1_DICPU|nr:uncharacterized protein DICPUDRAFT_25267 [Dictyostelium purpureum]EGC40382.1 hypothetical protein DICPUDRAFT_25267 [Dictyostelium purpureum]|eukprot:XP_003283133.1 hypothetical protein DICPUDRAFT_25267 [Dictyostelium purpureum]